MCPECGRFICEVGCPCVRGKALLVCSLCEGEIERGEKFYSIGVRPFCRECLEGADMDQLMRLFKYETREALLEVLGAVSRSH